MVDRILPMYGFLLVRRIKDEEEKTESGIVLPGKAPGRFAKGDVLKVGAGKPVKNEINDGEEVASGDVVLFKPYNVIEIKDDVVLVSIKDILAIELSNR